MDLRDQIAIGAMQSLIIARANLPEDVEESFVNAAVGGLGIDLSLKDEAGHRYSWLQLLADEAYEVADAMLVAKERSNVAR